MSEQYYSIVLGNADAFKNAALLNNNAQGGCVCCRSLIWPRYIKETTTCSLGRVSALCPFCGVPSLIEPSILKTRAFYNWDKLQMYHLKYFGHLHADKNLGKTIVAASWYDDKKLRTITVNATIPNNKNDASHMRNFLWETSHVGILEPCQNIEPPRCGGLTYSMSMGLPPRNLPTRKIRSSSMGELISLRPQHRRHNTTMSNSPRIDNWFADRMK